MTKTEVTDEDTSRTPDPVVTRTEKTLTGTDEEGRTYSQYERVIKTTTVRYTTEPPTVTKTAGTADIVFVIDRSGSMRSSINSVRENISQFVANINREGVQVRFGLATYSDEVYGRASGRTDEDTILTTFGSTYFTSDPAAFARALDAISMASGGDSDETATPALNQIIATYDWSRAANNKKFVVLVTDAFVKEDPSLPSLAATTAALQAAGIERIVATFPVRSYREYYSGFASEGRLINHLNLAESLNIDTANWIVETVVEGRRYKITTDSYDLYLERRTDLPQEPVAEAEAPAATPTAAVYPIHEEASAAPVAKESQPALPQTGSADTATYSLVGLGLLMAGLSLAVGPRKFKEN